MKWKRKLNENKLINCDYKLLKLKRTEKTVLYKKPRKGWRCEKKYDKLKKKQIQKTRMQLLHSKLVINEEYIINIFNF